MLREVKYDPIEKRLVIWGDISQLSMTIDRRFTDKSLIHTLGVDHLDLRGVENIDPLKMKNLKLKTLDVRGIRINAQFDPSTTEAIYLDEDKVDPEVISKIKDILIVNP